MFRVLSHAPEKDLKSAALRALLQRPPAPATAAERSVTISEEAACPLGSRASTTMQLLLAC